ncbi:uncharacterized protein LOC108631435 [Ceratina calcarata]|uniref:Uncharacterized protein LOC108631435 n=1 Tax=Ceratina calcarata TaxID=156304 RepID=A0AAJ7NE42_9HYME|nr:uncharacterized protein LOC108631435 [Ceratina calcarata]
MGEKRLAKPQLRDLHLSRVRKNMGIMLTVSALGGLAFKLLVSDVYERKFEEFYKTYDAEASLKKMNEAGLMDSYKG